MSSSPGKQPTEAEVQQIIKEVDLDGDGTINFNGMYPLLLRRGWYPTPRTWH